MASALQTTPVLQKDKEEPLRIATIEIQADSENLVEQKQYQISHQDFFNHFAPNLNIIFSSVFIMQFSTKYNIVIYFFVKYKVK